MLKQDAISWVESRQGELTEIAQKIWDNAEECGKEQYACSLQKDYLERNGFRVVEYADIPTAFMAEYGQGKPVLGVLGEYDALKNLSQEVCAEQKPIKEGAPGHGCGHNLLGTGCLGAAMAVKQLIESGAITGTIRYYGCPAEETLLGKVLMSRRKAFDDLDACLTWHPSSITMPWSGSLLSLISAVFSFKGKGAHAGSAPHMGRSALDAVELMNVGANYMREHVQEQNRIHYIIKEGGVEPNTVPAHASVWYNVRAPKRAVAAETFRWLADIARGAALMTQTRLEKIEIISGCYEVLPNQTLVGLLEKNMRDIGGPRFTDEDRAFAEKLSGGLEETQKAKGLESNFIPLTYMDQSLHEGVEPPRDFGQSLKASTDVGDVSWITPLAMFGAATWPLGVVAHTWQSTAASGSGIGFHAMHYAAKVLAATLVDLYTDGGALSRAQAEFRAAAGKKPYVSIFDEQFV